MMQGRLSDRSSTRDRKSSSSSSSLASKKATWILGSYYRDSQKLDIRNHTQTLFRLTYRKNFAALSPYDWMTSDAGWGCMLRSAQMLMANAMQRHYLGADWRRGGMGAGAMAGAMGHSGSGSADRAKYAKVLKLFLDFAGDPCHMYGIHNLVQSGMKYDKLPGEWYGPSTVSLVMRDLARLHRRVYGGPLEVLVANGDTIYISEAEKICTAASSSDTEGTGAEEGAAWNVHTSNNSNGNGNGVEDTTKTGAGARAADQLIPPTGKTGTCNDPLSCSREEDLGTSDSNNVADGDRERDSLSENLGNGAIRPASGSLGSVGEQVEDRVRQLVKERAAERSQKASLFDPYDPLLHPPPQSQRPSWKCALLVMVPLRLGIHSVNEEYVEELKAFLRHKNSVGFVGGRPNHALYFAGYRYPDTFLGLDPHTTYANVPKPCEAECTGNGNESAGRHGVVLKGVHEGTTIPQDQLINKSLAKNPDDIAPRKADATHANGNGVEAGNDVDVKMRCNSSDYVEAFSSGGGKGTSNQATSVDDPVSSSGKRVIEPESSSSSSSRRPIDSFPDREVLSQVHVDEFEELDASQLDPSLALAFYFRDRDEFEEFCAETKANVEAIRSERAAAMAMASASGGVHVSRSALYTVEYAAPSYAAERAYSDCSEDEMDGEGGTRGDGVNGGSAMGLGVYDVDVDEIDDDDEDDDYVLL